MLVYTKDKIITLQKENICVVMNAQIFLSTHSFALKFKNSW